MMRNYFFQKKIMRKYINQKSFHRNSFLWLNWFIFLLIISSLYEGKDLRLRSIIAV